MLLVAEYERTGSYSATAQHFGVHENTVKRWVERFTLTGDVLTASRERVSTVVTPAFLDVALKLVDEGYRDLVYGVESWSDLLREIRSQGFTCSRRTLVDTLKKQGVVLRTLRRRPSLTLEHKEKRLQFCKAMLEKSDAQLLHFVYCDEKKFTCGRGRSGRTYLCRSTDPHKEQRGELESWYGGNGIMVWMGVSVSVLPWPAKSPDLNPIENLWSVMDTDKNLLRPRNRQQLEAAIEESFLKLKQTHSATVQKTLKSFRKRCEIVIGRNGGHCGY